MALNILLNYIQSFSLLPIVLKTQQQGNCPIPHFSNQPQNLINQFSNFVTVGSINWIKSQKKGKTWTQMNTPKTMSKKFIPSQPHKNSQPPCEPCPLNQSCKAAHYQQNIKALNRCLKNKKVGGLNQWTINRLPSAQCLLHFKTVILHQDSQFYPKSTSWFDNPISLTGVLLISRCINDHGQLKSVSQ